MEDVLQSSDVPLPFVSRKADHVTRLDEAALLRRASIPKSSDDVGSGHLERINAVLIESEDSSAGRAKQVGKMVSESQTKTLFVKGSWTMSPLKPRQ